MKDYNTARKQVLYGLDDEGRPLEELGKKGSDDGRYVPVWRSLDRPSAAYVFERRLRHSYSQCSHATCYGIAPIPIRNSRVHVLFVSWLH